MDLSVVIVNFNTKELLRECLQSIIHSEGISQKSREAGILRSEHQQLTTNHEIIIVDNGSTDGSVEMVKKFKVQSSKFKIKLIENRKNLGFAKANNQALRQAQGKYCLLLNSDTKIIGNALRKLVDFAESKPNLGAVGPRLLNPDGSFQPSTAPFFILPRVALWLLTGDRFLYSSPDSTREVNWVMGAALLVSRRAIDKAGLLDEKFFMYMEEVEWCYRIKKAGFKIWFYPGAEIYHLVRGSSPADWRGKQRAILGIYRGLIYFYQKHFACWQLAVLKLALQTKAAGAWLIGVLTNREYLKQTYAKAFKVAR